jgi:hypothetical protein
MAKCQAKTKSGQPCKMAAVSGGQFCFTHNPATRASQAKARKKGGHNRARHGGNASTIPTQINNLQEAGALLAYIVQELLIMDNGVPRARALLQAYEMYLKTFEIGELEARIKALEESQGSVNVWPFSPAQRN